MSRKAERQARQAASRDLADAEADARHWRGRAARATKAGDRETFERGVARAEAAARAARGRLR